MRVRPIIAPAVVVCSALSKDLGKLQYLQLLFGERLIGAAVKGNPGWLYVWANDQGVLSGCKFHGYEGYVRAASVVCVDSFPKYNLVVCSPIARLFYVGKKQF